MQFGSAFLVVGGVVAVVLFGQHAPRVWRMALFLPFWLGALGVLQAMGKTCVALVAVGQRDMDGAREAVASGAELEQLRRQARQIRRKALVCALALTAAALFVPV
jgi:hypothetical protein